MSDLSAAKRSYKNIEVTREKLTGVKKGDKLHDQMPVESNIPPLSAKKPVPQKSPDKDDPVAQQVESQFSIRSGSGLKMLRITSAANQEESKGADKTRGNPGEIRAPKRPAAQAAQEEEPEQYLEPALMLSPSNTAPMRRTLRFKIMNVAGVLASAVWIGLSLGYVQTYIGWSEILALQPHLLGGFLAGALAPLALLWMVLAYAQRGADVHMYADALRAELQAMIFPSEERAQVIHRDIEDLCRQAAELSTASTSVLKSIHRARMGLRSEIKNLGSMNAETETHIDLLAQALEERSASLRSLMEEIEKRVAGIESKTAEGANAWDAAAKTMFAQSAEVEDIFSKSTEKILGTAEKVTETARVGELLAQQVTSLETVTEKASSSLENVGRSLEENREALDEGLMALSQKVEAMAGALTGNVEMIRAAVDKAAAQTEGLEKRLEEKAGSLQDTADHLDKKAQAIETAGSEAAHKLEEAMSVAVSSAENMSASVRRAVEGLSKTSAQAEKQAENMLTQTDERIGDLNREAEKQTSRIQALVSMLEEGRSALEKTSEQITVQAEDISRNVGAQADKFKNMQEEAAACMESVSHSGRACPQHRGCG